MSLSTYSCGTSLVVSSVDLIGEWVETLSGDFVDSDEFLSSGQRSPVESIEILPNNGACIAWLDSLPEDASLRDIIAEHWPLSTTFARITEAFPLLPRDINEDIRRWSGLVVEISILNDDLDYEPDLGELDFAAVDIFDLKPRKPTSLDLFRARLAEHHRL